MSWRPLERPEPDDPRLIGVSVDRLARSLGVAESKSMQAVFGGWQKIVGSAVAAHCSPVTLEDEVLVVRVDNPAWATQLRLMGPEILDSLAKQAGVRVAKEIRFKVSYDKQSKRHS